jgi:hypothetical protein
MRRSFRAGVSLIVVGLWPCLAPSQKTQNSAPSEKNELTLSIILEKEHYSSGEKLFTRTKFTNVSRTTLCFPQPSQEEIAAWLGVLRTTVTPPISGQEEEQFLEVFDGGGTWPRDKLLHEIKERWVWLRPTESYVTTSLGVRTTLSSPGQWRINVSYRPPEGSFHPAEYRKYLGSAAESVGCALPQAEIAADPVSFSVSQ